MEINADTKVGEIVRVNFKTAQIFEQHKIDFCCGGDQSIGTACSETITDVESLVLQLHKAMLVEDSDARYFDKLSPAALCDYIVERHHSYVKENMPFLQLKLQKLCDVHGSNHPEIFEIKTLFDGAATNLSAHMKNEEQVLFPYIKQLLKAHDEKSILKIPEFNNAQNLITTMLDEHRTEGERFVRIASLTHNYQTPPDGCTTFEVTYQTLQNFESDLHKHIHLENNILYHKAIALENEFAN